MTGALPNTLEELLGPPLWFEELKHKPGRRRTVRAAGRGGTAIVKLYASERAPTVAERIEALGAGPADPIIPRVLLCDPDRRLVVLSHVPGAPLSRAVLAGDRGACRRAGAALGAWHGHWTGRAPPCLDKHSAEREVEILHARAGELPGATADTVRRLARRLGADWECPTVIHRDLYEEQILVGEGIGLIDLDDAATGPPELDIGNLLAHLELLSLRSRDGIAGAVGALLDGYESSGPVVDRPLLDRCRRLSLLRLVCIHREPRLLPLAVSPAPGTPT